MMINCDNTRATMLQALLIGLLVASTHAVGTEMGSSELATLFQEHDWTFDEYKPRDRKGKVIHTISLEAPRPMDDMYHDGVEMIIQEFVDANGWTLTILDAEEGAIGTDEPTIYTIKVTIDKSEEETRLVKERTARVVQNLKKFHGEPSECKIDVGSGNAALATGDWIVCVDGIAKHVYDLITGEGAKEVRQREGERWDRWNSKDRTLTKEDGDCYWIISKWNDRNCWAIEKWYKEKYQKMTRSMDVYEELPKPNVLYIKLGLDAPRNTDKWYAMSKLKIDAESGAWSHQENSSYLKVSIEHAVVPGLHVRNFPRADAEVLGACEAGLVTRKY